VDDHAALVAALRDCAVVVNCAGPFTMLGPPVVRAAIDAGRHYVDTAGEQPYVASVFATHGAAAERAGVSVVPAANDGCLPVDLVTHLVAAGDHVEQISTLHLIDGDTGMSRGSLRSLLTVLGTQDNGVAAPPGALPFPMCEVVTIPRHVTVRRVAGFVNASLAGRLATPPAPELIDSLPDGPDTDAPPPPRVPVHHRRRAGRRSPPHRSRGGSRHVRHHRGRRGGERPPASRRYGAGRRPRSGRGLRRRRLLAFLGGHGVTWRTGLAEA